MKDLGRKEGSETKPNKAGSNLKNAPSVHHEKVVVRFLKADIRYWRERVSRRTEGSNYGIHIAYQGRRVRFNLETTRKDVAAAKAREIHQHLVAVGWNETLMKYKPALHSKPSSCSLGDYINAVVELSTQNSKTIAIYIRKTRTVISEMRHIKKPENIYNPQGNAFREWRQSVDATPLSSITALNLQKWKKSRIDAASDPANRATTVRTVNSLLRNAKALFGEKFRAEISGSVEVPSPIPFSDVQLERAPQKQFRSILKDLGGLPWLITAAKNELTPKLPKVDQKSLRKSKEARELAASKHQQFKCLLLGLACGMRRGEIDMLHWNDLNFGDCSIAIRNTEHGSLKTDASEAIIGAPSQVMDALRGYMPSAKGEFVVESTRRPNPNAKYPSYRCEVHFERLSSWLRSKGIDVAKPLHQLRGECATAIAAESGILAAAQQLRHSSLQTTKTYYSDRLRFAFPEIGEALEETSLEVAKEEGVQ